MNKRVLGFDKEFIASEYLKERGLEILDKNFSSSHAEIDIIARDGNYIVFVEVKYRKSTLYGYPLEAVGYSKQKRIMNAARFYLYKNHYSVNTYIRFDCIGICGDNIEWIKNAFS